MEKQLPLSLILMKYNLFTDNLLKVSLGHQNKSNKKLQLY